MRYVILRDDDTNALTPPSFLERLYRPFLDRQLPVNLAVIPNVRTDITYGQNILEGFLVARPRFTQKLVPITDEPTLVRYLLDNPGYHIAQHGYNHEFVRGDCEFEQHDRFDLVRRLEDGSRLLIQAGFPAPETFVAPYDRFTRTILAEVARRFRVISSAWFELGRLPFRWWPRYLLKKLGGQSHWRTSSTILLSHPRCYLSHRRPYGTMLQEIKECLQAKPLTVLVTHWWEFFRDNRPDDAFIEILHCLAEYLAHTEDLRVVTFRDVADGRVPLRSS
jgi:predicted deacetylase